jgi:hypothetical protein
MMVPSTIQQQDFDSKVDLRELGFWSNADQQFYSSGIKSTDLGSGWLNIGVISNNSVQTFYLNGVAKGSTAKAFTGPLSVLGGANLDKSTFRWGVLGSFRVWNSSISELEMQASLSLAIVYSEEQVVAPGVANLTLSNSIFTENPMVISVYCKTTLGKSLKATTLLLGLPKPPLSAKLRVRSATQVEFVIIYPNDDGGANIIHWKVVMNPPTADASTEITHAMGNNGPVVLNSANVGTEPRVFSVFGCSLLGCR